MVSEDFGKHLSGHPSTNRSFCIENTSYISVQPQYHFSPIQIALHASLIQTPTILPHLTANYFLLTTSPNSVMGSTLGITCSLTIVLCSNAYPNPINNSSLNAGPKKLSPNGRFGPMEFKSPSPSPPAAYPQGRSLMAPSPPAYPGWQARRARRRWAG